MWLMGEGRDALILSVCNALFWAGLMMSITFTALVGREIAPAPALATLPLALLTVSNIVLAGPISLFMQRRGRRAGFTLGAVAGGVGGFVCAAGAALADFTVFCAGNLVFGAAMATSQYYRLAAVDRVAPERRGRAIAVVLLGGVVAALAAPPLALWTKDLIPTAVYAGSFLGLGVLCLSTLLPARLLPSRPVGGGAEAGSGRPFAAIARQPVFLAALANAAIGHAVMILVMHTTPLAMQAHHHGVDATADVIRWHVLGMFVPSFFTGRLIDRLGAPRVAAAGALVLGASAVVAAWDPGLPHFYAGLLLLGIGWNFMYVSGTALLTLAYSAEERGRVQGAFEMLVAGGAALASFASAGLLNLFGWSAVNLGALPLLAVALGVTGWYGWRHRRALLPA